MTDDPTKFLHLVQLYTRVDAENENRLKQIRAYMPDATRETILAVGRAVGAPTAPDAPNKAPNKSLPLRQQQLPVQAEKAVVGRAYRPNTMRKDLARLARRVLGNREMSPQAIAEELRAQGLYKDRGNLNEYLSNVMRADPKVFKLVRRGRYRLQSHVKVTRTIAEGSPLVCLYQWYESFMNDSVSNEGLVLCKQEGKIPPAHQEAYSAYINLSKVNREKSFQTYRDHGYSSLMPAAQVSLNEALKQESDNPFA
jgi:hypothetical protein